ncbi:unnamed protein product [Anisakis simplex]|uniref:Uncharacterized protein n=1 Tax=Anisakis simplex TaxID=6269 RepID=A0A0M3JU89_ANISI|nr:unnamed protein product [Anisakis simplex]
MAKIARWIEPKPAVMNAHDRIPLLLVPVSHQPAIAIPTQIIPAGSVFVDAQSLQSNMHSNREGEPFTKINYLFMFQYKPRCVDQVY